MNKLIEAFANGGATGLAMLAMLIVIVFLIRTIVVSNRQLVGLFDKMAEASKTDAEANKALSVAITRLAEDKATAVALARIEARIDAWTRGPAT